MIRLVWRATMWLAVVASVGALLNFAFEVAHAGLGSTGATAQAAMCVGAWALALVADDRASRR